MEKIALLLWTEEQAYAERLSKQLAVSSKHFQIILKKGSPDFLNGEGGTSLAKLLLEFDLLVLEDSIKIPEQEEIKRNAEKGRIIFFPCPCKVSELVSRIQMAYAKVFGKEKITLDITGETTLIGFASGAGGVGKTAAALAFCKFISRDSKKRTLYLSFEEFDSTSFYVEQSAVNRSLQDFLYYLFSAGEKQVATYLDVFLQQDACGMYFFSTKAGRNELRSLSPEELICFFQILTRYGQFQCIVLDIPLCLDDKSVFLMRSCKNLVLVGDKRLHSQHKNQAFQNYLVNTLDLEQQLLILDTQWEEENFMEQSRGLEIDIHHQLGREVRELAKQLDWV